MLNGRRSKAFNRRSFSTMPERTSITSSATSLVKFCGEQRGQGQVPSSVSRGGGRVTNDFASRSAGEPTNEFNRRVKRKVVKRLFRRACASARVAATSSGWATSASTAVSVGSDRSSARHAGLLPVLLDHLERSHERVVVLILRARGGQLLRAPPLFG